jgi:hypothetical protein
MSLCLHLHTRLYLNYVRACEFEPPYECSITASNVLLAADVAELCVFTHTQKPFHEHMRACMHKSKLVAADMPGG